MPLVGDIKELSLPDIFQTYCMARLTARLTVSYAVGCGVFFIEAGEIVDATLNGRNGLPAVYEALHYQEGRFCLDVGISPTRHTISESWQNVLMEGMRLLDEAQAGLRPVPNTTESYSEPGPALTPLAGETPSALLNATLPYQPPSFGDKILQSLTVAGAVEHGIVLDEDNEVVCEIGTVSPSMTQISFLLQGLESVVGSYFELGECEGIVLEVEEKSLLIARQKGLSCVFFRPPKVPLARALSDVRGALGAMLEVQP